MLSDNDALVYEYRLSGSEEPRHIARLVVQFDPEGVRPLQVESAYGRYRSVTDLEAASTRIYIKQRRVRPAFCKKIESKMLASRSEV